MITTEIIPVIHVVNNGQAMLSVDICQTLNVEKIFLISHSADNENLLWLAHHVKKIYPMLWVGVNLLGIPTEDALKMIELEGIDGLWADQTITSILAKQRIFKGKFFGGLAFKYQPDFKLTEAACEEAKLATDVATTSGEGTGKAAKPEKITKIREYLGKHPMAIASGVSIENIKNYKGIANYLLVASSITDPQTEIIISEKLKELIKALE